MLHQAALHSSRGDTACVGYRVCVECGLGLRPELGPQAHESPTRTRGPATRERVLLEFVHLYVYDPLVKRREPESRLRALGWTFLRHAAATTSGPTESGSSTCRVMPKSTRTSRARS